MDLPDDSQYLHFAQGGSAGAPGATFHQQIFVGNNKETFSYTFISTSTLNSGNIQLIVLFSNITIVGFKVKQVRPH